MVSECEYYVALLSAPGYGRGTDDTIWPVTWLSSGARVNLQNADEMASGKQIAVPLFHSVPAALSLSLFPQKTPSPSRSACLCVGCTRCSYGSGPVRDLLSLNLPVSVPLASTGCKFALVHFKMWIMVYSPVYFLWI